MYYIKIKKLLRQVEQKNSLGADQAKNNLGDQPSQKTQLLEETKKINFGDTQSIKPWKQPRENEIGDQGCKHLR